MLRTDRKRGVDLMFNSLVLAVTDTLRAAADSQGVAVVSDGEFDWYKAGMFFFAASTAALTVYAVFIGPRLAKPQVSAKVTGARFGPDRTEEFICLTIHLFFQHKGGGGTEVVRATWNGVEGKIRRTSLGFVGTRITDAATILKLRERQNLRLEDGNTRRAVAEFDFPYRAVTVEEDGTVTGTLQIQYSRGPDTILRCVASRA